MLFDEIENLYFTYKKEHEERIPCYVCAPICSSRLAPHPKEGEYVEVSVKMNKTSEGKSTKSSQL